MHMRVCACACVSCCRCWGRCSMVLGRMCVVLQVMSRSVVLPVLKRMCVVLQVLGQVLGLVLVLGLGRGRGRGLLRSSLFTHPQHFNFANPGQPRSQYISNNTGTTPKGKTRYIPGMISERYRIFQPPTSPEPHFLTPHTNKRVSTCSEFKRLINHLLSALIQPKTLPKHFFTSFLQLMHNAIRELQVWNELLVICLNTPPRLTWGHSMHFYDQAPNPPPNYQITQQGFQSNRLELRIPKMYLMSRFRIFGSYFNRDVTPKSDP